jgi:uncharacterized protein YecA (UPF0149 family)
MQRYSTDIERKLKRKTKTTFDAIQAFYADRLGKTKLTEEQEQIRYRWEQGFNYLVHHKSKEETVKFLIKRFKVSRATAYHDINDCMQIFGDLNKSSKEGLKHILTEMAMKVFNYAEQERNLAEMNKAIKNIKEIHGLGTDEEPVEDWKKYIPTTVIINANPATLQQMADELVEDVDYENYDEESDDEGQDGTTGTE